MPCTACVVVPEDVALEAVCLVGCGVTTSVLAAFKPARLRRDGRLLGATMGGPHAPDIPMLVELYRARRLKLDELVTRRVELSEINEGVAAVHAVRDAVTGSRSIADTGRSVYF